MFLSLILTLAVALQPIAQIKSPTAIRQTNARTEVDRRIAAALAPVIYQGLGDHPRADYLTNFDFDGDWKGDNNWKNLDNKTFPLKAYVYFSVIETTTHYYVHYAFFHPRDYKGGMLKTALVETLIAANGADSATPVTVLEIRHLGGAMTRVPDDAASFSQRHAPFLMQTLCVMMSPEHAVVAKHNTQRVNEAIQPFTTGGVLPSWLGDGDHGAERVRAGFSPEHYARLAELKRRYDPENMFCQNHNVPPKA